MDLSLVIPCYNESEGIPTLRSQLEAVWPRLQERGSVELELPVLIDHMGRANPAAGAQDPSRSKLVELLRRGNFWVMLSLGEKISRAGPPWDDVIPLARALIDAAPDRVVWATDWPHPVSTRQPPNEGDLIELLYRYAPDEATLKKILVDNPAKLFGFDR